MTLQWPAFCLARNLAGIHNLMESDPPGRSGLQPFLAAQMGQRGLSPPFSKANHPLHRDRPKRGLSWAVTAMSSTWEAPVEEPLRDRL